MLEIVNKSLSDLHKQLNRRRFFLRFEECHYLPEFKRPCYLCMKGISVLQTFAGKTCIKIPCTELEKGIIPLLIAWIIKMIPSFSLNPVSIKPPPPPCTPKPPSNTK